MVVTADFMMNAEEKNAYVDYIINENKGRKINAIMFNLTEENGEQFVDITTEFGATKFDRIRRITGYLVGTVDRWNSGKLSELNDREKHSV